MSIELIFPPKKASIGKSSTQADFQLCYNEMKEFIKCSLASIGRFLPKYIGKVPYNFFFRRLVAYAHQLSIEVWPRNSFINSAFHPLKSDLDLTIWFNDEIDKNKLSTFLKYHSRQKRLFPLLGETAVHSPLSKSFISNANFFEISRDPLLTEKLSMSERKPNRDEAVVFLAKMLEADIHNLIIDPAHRSSKWHLHFNFINSHFKQIKDPKIYTVEKIISTISALIDSREQVILWNYYQEWSGDKKLHDVKLSPLLWSLFPNRFCFAHESAPRLPKSYENLFYAAIGWELWGLLSQIHYASQRDVEHLLRIELTVEKVLEDRGMIENLKHNISLLIDIIRSMLRTN